MDRKNNLVRLVSDLARDLKTFCTPYALPGQIWWESHCNRRLSNPNDELIPGGRYEFVRDAATTAAAGIGVAVDGPALGILLGNITYGAATWYAGRRLHAEAERLESSSTIARLAKFSPHLLS